MAGAIRMYNDLYRKGRKQPKEGWEAAVAEVRSLDASIQTVYVRKSRQIAGRSRERWEAIGKVCLACHELWPDLSTGFPGFADRHGPGA